SRLGGRQRVGGGLVDRGGAAEHDALGDPMLGQERGGVRVQRRRGGQQDRHAGAGGVGAAGDRVGEVVAAGDQRGGAGVLGQHGLGDQRGRLLPRRAGVAARRRQRGAARPV